MNLDKIICLQNRKGCFLSFYRWIVKAMEDFPIGKFKLENGYLRKRIRFQPRMDAGTFGPYAAATATG